MTQRDLDQKPRGESLVDDTMQKEKFQLPITEPPPYAATGSNVQNDHDGVPRRRGILNTHGRIFFSIFAVTILLVFYLYPSPSPHVHFNHRSHHHHHHHQHDSERINQPCHKQEWPLAGQASKPNHRPHPVPVAESESRASQLKSHLKQIPNLFSSCNTTRTMTEPITGEFDLYDCLDLSTLAGTIDVVITVMPGQRPAKLKLSAASGNVKVNVGFSDDGESLRPIYTDIAAAAGSVFANMPIGAGSRTDLRSAAGMLDARLLAFDLGSDDPVSRVTTNTESGWQKIVVEPLRGYSGKISNLEAVHTTSSGPIDVSYAPEWEGVVKAQAGPWAMLDAGCRDLIVDRSGDGSLVGHRGVGERVVEVAGIGGGRVRFMC